MAVVSGLQLVLDFQAEQRERQSLLAVSLPPLISQLQDATTHEEVREVLTRFHGSYLERGHGHHQVRVVESDGRVLFEAGDKQDAVPARLAASAALRMPGLWPTSLSVVVTQGGTEITERRVNRWKAWAVHVGLTALLIVSLLLFVIRKQITTPVERLLQSIRKMELGYWDDMPDPGGAWELRWLASRFRLLTEAQSATLLQLLAAHRRAYEASAISRDAAHFTRVPAGNETPGPGGQGWNREVLRRLEARLMQLREVGADAPAARKLAQAAWTFDATEAERVGSAALRAELEDAAMRVLEPEEFSAVERQLKARLAELEARAQAYRAEIEAAMALRGVQLVEMSSRIKHIAGVMKKMREKALSFEQVHDLLAMRIIVPTESDCYRSLGVIHDLYPPIVGRFKDYIVQPKRNGYRGLHSSVHGTNESIFEVQIRSVAMHQVAENGCAAHADYNAAKVVSLQPAASVMSHSD
jgi:hypothetical protein